jgi:4-aminobutyrate aminotransferase-like enzyme
MPSDAANDFWTKASRSLLKTGVPFSPAVIVNALGTRLYDIEGNQILDFTSGQMSSLLGHSHPEIVQVIQKSAAELDHLLSNMISPPVVDLGERLRRILPRPLEKSFFLNTGGVNLSKPRLSLPSAIRANSRSLPSQRVTTG